MILDKIVEMKKEEVAEMHSRPETRYLGSLAREAAVPRDFVAALKTRARVPIIAEIKKKSPSAGPLNGGTDVAARARRYEAGGASALSVLTDGPFFGGSLSDLKEARDATHLPVLRKDFIIDPLQVFEARAAGADAVLLIAAILPDGLLAALYGLVRSLGMAALMEVHNEAELERVLPLEPRMIGVNNRNLATMTVDLDTCRRLRPLIPASTLVVAESGFSRPEEVRDLYRAGLDAFLIGTTLMKANDPASVLSGLAQAGGRECHA